MSQRKFTRLLRHLRAHTLDDTQAVHSLWVPDGDVWNASDTMGTITLQVLGMMLLYILVSQIKYVFSDSEFQSEDITGGGNANPGDGFAINSDALKNAGA